MSDRDAKNFKAISEAKKKHDAECPYKGQASRILMAKFDIERLDWQEGDTICGLVVIADPGRGTGSFRIECDNEPDNTPDIEIEEVVKTPTNIPVHA